MIKGSKTTEVKKNKTSDIATVVVVHSVFNVTPAAAATIDKPV